MENSAGKRSFCFAGKRVMTSEIRKMKNGGTEPFFRMFAQTDPGRLPRLDMNAVRAYNRGEISGRTQMRKVVLYVHGLGGNASEAMHYAPLFPGSEVVGMDYRASTPWEAGREIGEAVRRLKDAGATVTLVANSIGAYFSLHAGIDAALRKAYFISPVVDMERLIRDRMARAGVTEAELASRGAVHTDAGDELSWEYLRFVTDHPVCWNTQTEILYGAADALIPRGSVEAFAAAHGAKVTVMTGGEHWFHTEPQMRFLDAWIRRGEAEREP